MTGEVLKGINHPKLLETLHPMRLSCLRTPDDFSEVVLHQSIIRASRCKHGVFSLLHLSFVDILCIVSIKYKGSKDVSNDYSITMAIPPPPFFLRPHEVSQGMPNIANQIGCFLAAQSHMEHLCGKVQRTWIPPVGLLKQLLGLGIRCVGFGTLNGFASLRCLVRLGASAALLHI